jgi:hypothetical protein
MWHMARCRWGLCGSGVQAATGGSVAARGALVEGAEDGVGAASESL